MWQKKKEPSKSKLIQSFKQIKSYSSLCPVTHDGDVVETAIIMETHQELEWGEAQNIYLSQDLVATAKQQLLFLAEVDRNRCLYDGPVLHRANYRYICAYILISSF